MGKRRVGFKKAKTAINSLPNAASSDEENELEALLDDEIDQFNSTKEQELVAKSRKKPGAKIPGNADSDDEQEVYGLNLDTSDEEDDDNQGVADSDEDEDDDGEDEEGDEDDDEDVFGGRGDDGFRLPDSRAWGRKAKSFHNTDYVDQDFGGMEGEDAEKAELEEEEAKAIQKRLTAELDESDFMDFLPTKTEVSKATKKVVGKEILKIDLKNLSAVERRKLVERECPEIPHLLQEFNDKMKDIAELQIIMEHEERPVLKKYYDTKFHILTNYCINISFFLFQRSSNASESASHPSVKKILQYRRLIEELSNFNVKKLASSDLNQLKSSVIPASAKASKVSADGNKVNDETLSTAVEDLPEGGAMEEGMEAEKRSITYQMAKNKGLMPHRKKEQRNPRVKHREKFRKAVVRRKGQVRMARTEKERYGGEMSGIKSHVTKSIKLK